MAGAEAKYLTTGQAARLLAVTPDTVLKWIHRGRIAAVQTAGGHHRIGFEEIRKLMGEANPEVAQSEAAPGVARCWEYLGGGGAVRTVCLDCAVYRFRAARCYEVWERLGAGGTEERLCSGSCAVCPYYLRTHRLPQRVLVVSRDEAWVAEWRDCAVRGVELAYAGGVYEASAVVGEFLPGVVLLDAELPGAELAELSEALRRDRRIPWVRVYVAGGSASAERALSREVRAEDLAVLASGARVEEEE